jgi:hypothetical protein
MIQELLEFVKFIYGFLPWILFLFLPTDGWEPLQRAVAVCFVASLVFGWDTLRKGFILQWFTVGFFLFSAIALYGFSWVWLAEHMGIIANGFLDGVIWLTVLTGNPFTLQYAREELPRERWYEEGVIRTCQSIAIFWGALLLVPTTFSVFRLLYPTALPAHFYFYLSLLCMAIGAAYTTIYKRKKREERQAMSHRTPN